MFFIAFVLCTCAVALMIIDIVFLVIANMVLPLHITVPISDIIHILINILGCGGLACFVIFLISSCITEFATGG